MADAIPVQPSAGPARGRRSIVPSKPPGRRAGRDVPILGVVNAEAKVSMHEPVKRAPRGPLPKTFRRLVASRTGDSFREVATIVDLPMDMPGPGEVLVELRWAGVNGGCETFRVRGDQLFYSNRGKTNFPLGAEGSGVVAAIGEGVDDLDIGQPVATNRISAFSEYGITRRECCTPVQEAGPEAAALTQSAVTACTALEVVGQMKPNEKVLVTAAAGGTGHFAVQLAKMQGCHVVATCGGADKAKALERLGLDRVIDYKRESVGGVLREEYPNGIDLVYEGVGGAMLRTCLDGLAPRGRLILVGYIAEYPHSKDCALSGRPIGDGLPCAADLFWGGTTIERDRQTIYGGVMPKDPQDIQRCRAKVFRLYEEGRLSAWIDRSNRYVGLESIPDAIDGMLKGGHIGKVVVEI